MAMLNNQRVLLYCVYIVICVYMCKCTQYIDIDIGDYHGDVSCDMFFVGSIS